MSTVKHQALSPTPHSLGDTDTPAAKPGHPQKQSTPLVIVRKPPAGHQAVSTSSTTPSSTSPWRKALFQKVLGLSSLEPG